MITLAIVLALALDLCLAEPRRLHPLVLFGSLATRIEHLMYAPARAAPWQIVRGGVAVVLAIGLPVAPIIWLQGALDGPANWCLGVLVLYVALGHASLRQHAQPIWRALTAGDIASARVAVGAIVSRDSVNMSERQVCVASIESVLENGSDAIFGALFWFVVAGPAGAAIYRLSNTLDAMWGYRNTRYLYFGRIAARLDDLLNLLPSLLSALSYALAGATRSALHCWRTQGWHWYSVNAGICMASGAGALRIKLGGPACYEGTLRERPVLGCTRPPLPDDIARALALIGRALIWWVGCIAIGELLVHTL